MVKFLYNTAAADLDNADLTSCTASGGYGSTFSKLYISQKWYGRIHRNDMYELVAPDIV